LSPISPQNLFTIADAELILGEKAHFVDSSSAQKTGLFEYKSSYSAVHTEGGAEKSRNVYFMFEDYNEAAEAQKTLNGFKESNKNHKGFSLVKDLGDDAFFHTDSHNFYLIVVRKGKKMFRIKAHKLSKNTSLEAFNGVAKRITETL
jgi:hypothetical protein